MHVENQVGLLSEYGTASIRWTFQMPDSVFAMMDDDGRVVRTAKLSNKQSEAIKSLTPAISAITFDLKSPGRSRGALRLQLIGRQLRSNAWAGLAASIDDPMAMSQNMASALAFAEHLISEANSATVVIDRSGAIQRFNNRAEEYTGVSERDVIGLSAHELFMQSEEAQTSRSNVDTFFRHGAARDVKRRIRTVNGPRLFRFRNRLVSPASFDGHPVLICSGVEVVDTQSSGLPSFYESLIEETKKGSAICRLLAENGNESENATGAAAVVADILSDIQRVFRNELARLDCANKL